LKIENICYKENERKHLDIVSELAMLANPFAEKKKYRKHIEEELKSKPELALVAVKIKKVVGYVMGDVHNGHGILEDIAVDIAHQHQGIGTLLLETELKAIKNSKPKIIVAEVHYKCASAIPFYYKHGFRISGVWRNFFGIGRDAIMPELILSKMEQT
jgi:ribosomal protein S18 acetylase RimI-like enzyme